MSQAKRKDKKVTEAKLERIARQQAKALKATLELFSEVTYLDSDGRELLGELYRWLDHTKTFKKTA